MDYCILNQSKIESLLESIVNIIIGFSVAIASQIVIFPMFDIHIPFATNLWICAWFTIISLVRSYVIRRWFNAGLHKAIVKLAKKVALR